MSDHITISGLLKITRIWNLFIIVIAQYFTAVFLAHGTIPMESVLKSEKLLILALSTCLIAAAGYIINDYYDVKIDMINKPDRVVVGKTMKRRVAMFIHTAFSLTGIMLGFLLDWKIVIINFFSALLLWMYSNQLKRMPLVGNISVALLTGLSIYMVHFIFPAGHVLVIAYALFAFCFTLIREIIKDMEDLKGDATYGCRTLPVIFGIRKTKAVIYLLSAAFLITLFTLTYSYGQRELNYLSIGLVLPLSMLAFLLRRADTIQEFYRLSQYCKLVMLLGIFSMILFYT